MNCSFYLDGADFSIFFKQIGKFDFVVLITDVLDVDIGESASFFTKFDFTFLAGYESSDKDFLAIEQHAIDFLNGTQSSFLRFKVDESVS